MLRIDHSILRIIFLLLLSLSVEKGFTASLTSVNIDKKTTAAMTAVLAAANLAESQNVDAANEILKNYESAAVASSGIMLKEYEEHKAMCDPTSFFTSTTVTFLTMLSRSVLLPVSLHLTLSSVLRRFSIGVLTCSPSVRRQ